ncbi:hypothetical protein BKK79_10820 [Cupriavidus sp. USMAA2-4]|uniref:flavin reductase family protein n=1 Tax=unclassified Cupriavidus TaxID=2640874 RepID=UPI0008A7152D|nr:MULTISPECIES: flavin reductase family protein [unclassified Cupriavidus]AOY92213.1 hypothetical protein BKK79_10820 [Cupriavidus sp. USMAA2-4]AOY98217.1 hypothetical protein BKK81_02055 [Cupriavidus sp. USMAHM13]
MQPDLPMLSPFDRADLRRALGTFPTGVTVVTARGPDGQRLGVTANSFTSVSMDPPLVLWNLALSSPNLAAFQRCGHFAINVLAGDQAAICRQFATPSADKFDGVATLDGIEGVPLIEGAATQFECRTATSHPAGDHLILIGQIVRYRSQQASPLLFCQGRLQAYPRHPGEARTVG